MVYTSLIEAPRNFKEGVDWLVALRGTNGRKNLAAMGAAVYDFLADKPVGLLLVPSLEKVKRLSKEFLEQKDLEDKSYVKDLLGKFDGPMDKNSRSLKHLSGNFGSDYKNVVKSRGFKPDDIARNVGAIVSNCEMLLKNIKNPDHYNSAYSSEATWEASCAENPEACAVVLVGIAPMLYAGLVSLWDATNPVMFGSTTTADADLRKLVKALGYVEPECRDSLNRFNVRRALVDMNKIILPTIYEIAGFWAFY
ncbi:hypothetical protein, conserved [Babesia ovata]|uniref:Uncharacterized protein n=1 Tax=Babesia ovata TaxID=189622 RepID=A0A2H6K8G6_9APIC|nr:uncharacterized protein BOVATA_007790 [Babesia ovata]GBE59286.1 hypothetical protein, conserved [Babesia ovata]